MGPGRTLDLERIFEAHEEELRLVEEHLRSTFQTDVMLLSLIGRHILKSGGKRMRPLFLIMSAKLAGYEGSDHIALASVIETIHTASLLHDDVVDGADMRRGMPAAHSVWGNQVVILAGDYLYSNALKQAVVFGSLPIMEALSKAVSMMAKGELLQLQKSGDVSLTEEEYTNISASKTGILFSSACRIGAILGGCSMQEEDALTNYGLKVGIAFQVADDILDYHADEGKFGKRLGTDLGEGKITLPLISLLKAAGEDEKHDIIRMVGQDECSEEDLDRILKMMDRYDIKRIVQEKARALVEEAKNELMVFPDSTERDELFALAEHALKRGR